MKKVKWDWLAPRMQELGISGAAFAKAIGWDPARVSEMRNGVLVNDGKFRNFPRDKVKPAAKELKVDLETLIDYNDDKIENVIFLEKETESTGQVETMSDVALYNISKLRMKNIIEYKDTVPIKVYDTKICAGKGIVNLSGDCTIGQYQVSWAFLSRYISTTPDNISIVQVYGDSMMPTIQDQDWVWVDQTYKMPTSDGVYIMRVGSEMMVKRIRINPVTNGAVITSDNHKYPPVDVSQYEDIAVIGRVFYIMNGSRI